ncbi:MAG: hypothetical protein ACXVCY_06345 [Pseudobdellovibrionaceae bacterium]
MFLPLLLIFSGCASLQIHDGIQSSLNGTWKLISFTCKGGDQDQAVLLNQKAVAEGRFEETMTIKDGTVILNSNHWDDSSKKSGCSVMVKQIWEVDNRTYRVAKAEVVSAEPRGNGKCSQSVKHVQLSGLSKSYSRFDDQLNLVISHNSSKKSYSAGAYAVCNGGDWVMTYKRIN